MADGDTLCPEIDPETDLQCQLPVGHYPETDHEARIVWSSTFLHVGRRGMSDELTHAMSKAAHWATELRDSGGPDLVEHARIKLGIEAREFAATPTLEEAADVLICLAVAMTREGLSLDRIAQAVEAKTIVNSARTWAQEPDGTWQHVPAPSPVSLGGQPNG